MKSSSLTISKVKHTKPVTYKIEVIKCEEIRGTFNKRELKKQARLIQNLESTKEAYKKQRCQGGICKMEKLQRGL